MIKGSNIRIVDGIYHIADKENRKYWYYREFKYGNPHLFEADNPLKAICTSLNAYLDFNRACDYGMNLQEFYDRKRSDKALS